MLFGAVEWLGVAGKRFFYCSASYEKITLDGSNFYPLQKMSIVSILGFAADIKILLLNDSTGGCVSVLVLLFTRI